MKGLTAGGGPGLPTACTALALTSIEIFEDSGEEKEGDTDTEGWQGQGEWDALVLAFLLFKARAGTGHPLGEDRILFTHMAVMVSLWKVTKAIPRGFSFTFSFSRL